MHRFGLDCSACSKEQKIERGCDEDSPIPDRWQIKDYKFKRCPVKLITSGSRWCINAYTFFDKGFLPNSKGWLEHSNKFIEMISIVRNEINSITKEEHHGRK